MSFDDTWVLLDRGLVGVHALTESGASVITYDPNLSRYYDRLAEGAWVIDKRELLEGSNAIALCLHSPLPDPRIPEGQRKACPVIPDSMLGPGGLEGAFLTVATLKTEQPDYSGLDSVALDVYADYWRQHGARIGRRRGSTILWEDQAREDIALEASVLPC